MYGVIEILQTIKYICRDPQPGVIGSCLRQGKIVMFLYFLWLMFFFGLHVNVSIMSMSRYFNKRNRNNNDN